MPDAPCPTCSGPSRETVGMVCQTCGTDYGPPLLIPPLPADSQLHVCVICGAVVAAKGVGFHDDWHRSISQAAIRAERRLDELEAARPGRGS